MWLMTDIINPYLLSIPVPITSAGDSLTGPIGYAQFPTSREIGLEGTSRLRGTCTTGLMGTRLMKTLLTTSSGYQSFREITPALPRRQNF